MVFITETTSLRLPSKMLSYKPMKSLTNRDLDDWNTKSACNQSFTSGDLIRS